MKAILILAISAVTWTGFAQNKPDVAPLVIGDQLTVHSEILNQDRIINVYLPPGYHPDSTKHYPVIYVLDGSMWEDFMHVAGVVQFESYSWINWAPESIVIGISNIDRKHDYTFPTTVAKQKEDFPTTGGSADFIRFIEKELIPEIDKRYPTTETRTLIGQSLGGLLATEILFKQPELFTHYLIVSPSLWWDEESLLTKMPEFEKQKTIHIAVGKEWKVMVKDAKALAKLLPTNKGVKPVVSFRYYKTLDHSNNLHEAVYFGLRELYKSK